MQNKRGIFVALALAGIFILGILQLINLRFSVGDFYPAYSSLRTDPTGCMILYESLQKVSGVEVSQNFQPFNRIKNPENKTLFILGNNVTDFESINHKTATHLEDFVTSGGRLIVAFKPFGSVPFQFEKMSPNRLNLKKQIEKFTNKNNPPVEDNSDTIVDSEEKNSDNIFKLKRRYELKEDQVSLSEELDVELYFYEIGINTDKSFESVLVTRFEENSALPDAMSWHTSLAFSPVNPDWKTLFMRNDLPVIIERNYGDGSIVLCSDSYFLSNEAMFKERYSGLLSYLIGSKSHVVFDEWSKGVEQKANIMILAKRYNLHGAIAGLLLLAFLFIWKNSSSLVPPPDDDSPENIFNANTGKDAASGFVNLLKKNIPASKILALCFLEWKKVFAKNSRETETKAEEMEKILQRVETDKSLSRVQAYQLMSRIVADKQKRLQQAETNNESLSESSVQ